MANTWPKEPRLIGKKTPRLDGPDKSTGRAKYSYDINPKGLLHAAILRCPHAHAKITKLDSAEKLLRGSGVSPSAAQLDPGAAVGMVAQINANIAAQEVRLATLRSVSGEANPATLAATRSTDAAKR